MNEIINDKKHILIMCYRPFDIRLMVSSGMLDMLSVHYKLVLLLPPNLISKIKKDIKGQFICEPLKYYTSNIVQTKLDEQFASASFIPALIDRTLQKIFFYVYGNLKTNLTQGLMTSEFLKARSNFFKRLSALPIVWTAKVASRFKFVRLFLQNLGILLNTPSLHQNVFDTYSPELMVVGSLGIANDALIMREAKKNRVPILSIIQSWDKTSSVGYPVVSPNHVIVWNKIMVDEVECYHDIDRNNIKVGGVPQWDHYFSKAYELKKENFIDRYQLRQDKKIIYFGLCSMGYHKGNIDAIELLINALDNDLFVTPVQILIRPHPAYYGALKEDYIKPYEELMSIIAEHRDHQSIRFLQPEIEGSGTAYIAAGDNQILHEMLLFSDVCVSVLSTQMIEAAILDTPVVTFEYGNWKTNQIDLDLSKLRFEHITRIFKTNAISRANTPPQLIERINEYLKDPDKKREERKLLADQEVPVNRGCAAREISQIISEFASIHQR